MRIAIVHDYFTQLGGAEQVAAAICEMLPGADLFAVVALPACMPPGLQQAEVHTSWMQRLPGMNRFYRHYFLLYPLGVESLDLSAYDVVISSSSGYGKGVRTRRDAIHVCYCHTPMRWAWSFGQYSERESMGKGKRALLSMLVKLLRRWDISASREPDHFIANSRTVGARILHAYGRYAEVIHPPIDTERFRPSTGHDDYYLILARLVSYKRIDLAIEACNALGRQLLVIGDGPDRPRLQKLAGPTITFAGRLSDHDVEYHASRCRAVIFPGEEDFGMVPLEVAAAGRPAIAYHAGGAIETIIDGVTGVFFDHQDPRSLADAIERLEMQHWNSDVLRRHAEAFSVEAFQHGLLTFLKRVGVRTGNLIELPPPVRPYPVREPAWVVSQDIAVS